MCKQAVVESDYFKKVQKIIAEDIMSIPTSLTRGKSVFVESAELAFA